MRKKAYLLALLLLWPAASAARADEASEALVKSYIDRIDKQDAWSASATRISSQGSATIVEGLKITRTDGSASFDAASIRLDRLVEMAGGGISIASFAADNLKLNGGPWSFTIPNMNAQAITTPGFAGWSFDPKAPFASLAGLYTGLAETEFDEVVIPKAEFSQEIGGPPKVSSKGSYVNFRLGALKKGMLASESIDRIETITMGPGPLPVTTVFEGLSAKNLDLGAFAHVFDPQAYAGGKGDGLWKMAFESGVYGRISVKNGDQEVFTAGPISTGRWQIRQTPEPIAPVFDGLLAAGKPEEKAFDKFMQDHIAAFLGWVKIGTVDIANIAAFPPDGGKIVLASAAVEDLSAESMKRFALEGLAAESSQLNIKLQKFELGDIAWPSVSAIVTLAKLQEAKEEGRPPDPLLVDKAAGEFMNVIPHVGKLSILGVEVGPPNTEPFRLGEYTATSEGGMALLPKAAKAKLSAVVIPRSILHITPDSSQIFDALGYSELVIDGEGEANHDEETGRYWGQGHFSVKDAGTLSLSDAIGGLTADRLKAIMTPFAMTQSGEPDQAQVLAALGPVSVETFTLRFDDASLTKRVLPLAAKMQGTDEATLIGNITAMLQLGLGALGNQAFTGEVVSSVGAFLKNPKSLTIALRPPQPVTLQQLMTLDPSKPGAVIDLLGVHVTAND
jgi:hypothetical protein